MPPPSPKKRGSCGVPAWGSAGLEACTFPQNFVGFLSYGLQTVSPRSCCEEQFI